MKKTIALFLSLAFVGACGGGANVDKIVKLKDEACACKDKACAVKVNAELDKALEDLGKAGKEPDEATTKKLMEAMGEAGTCIAKLQ